MVAVVVWLREELDDDVMLGVRVLLRERDWLRVPAEDAVEEMLGVAVTLDVALRLGVPDAVLVPVEVGDCDSLGVADRLGLTV